jgi:tRNA pseudouridine13 synthase
MHGDELGKATFRQCPEDFNVHEIVDFKPSGEGEHLLVHIQKRDQNTQWVAGLLAELANINRRDIGFCGLKDRFAIATQWYSLHLPGKEIDLTQLQHNDFQILSSGRHNKKLRRGDHAGNRFTIRLRDFDIDFEQISERLNKIQQQGVPNYFAEQRFGWDANNLVKAQQLIIDGRLKGNRQGTGMYLSAARSWLFNLLLDQYLLRGKVNFEDTGALWGRGRSATCDDFQEVERRVLEPWTDWCHALEHAGLKQQRRTFILKPSELTYQQLEKGLFELNFELPVGSYATAILREIAQLIRPEFKRL